MNRRVHTLLFALAALFCGSPHAWGEPNHLEPIDLYNHYQQIVFDVLVESKPAECWMICRPSFKLEYALVLRKEEIDPKPEPPDPFSVNRNANRKYRWILERAIAAEQIWHSYNLAEDQAKKDLRKNLKVDRKSVEVSREFGEALSKAWSATLHLTRYSEEPASGVDGVDYDFYSLGNYGTCWSPEEGLSADLVHLAGQLRAAVECAPEKRQSLLKEAQIDASKLANAAEAERKKWTRQVLPDK